MSVFRRGKGWVSKFQHAGKQHWTPDGPWTTKRMAQAAEDEYRAKVVGRRTDETCASFAARWLDEWPRSSPSTRRHYRYAVERFAGEFANTPLGDVERVNARAWALGVPRNTSKVVATMYQDAYNIGLVNANPFANLRLPKTEATQEVLSPTLEEFRSLLAACTTLGGYAGEFRAMIQFAAWTGIRAGELHALEWGDIDGDYVWVRRSLKTDGSIGKPKNGKERRIAYLPEARVLDQVPRRYGSDLIFHSKTGAPLNKGNSHYPWREVRAASGIPEEREGDGLPNVRWHDLRHFCATQLRERGFSPFDVSVQLGHEDGGALVMARYGHPSKEAALDRLLAGTGDFHEQTGSEAVAEA